MVDTSNELPVLSDAVITVGSTAGSTCRVISRKSEAPRTRLATTKSRSFTASTWPIHQIAEDYLYSAHMVQHMLLSMVIPIFLVLAAPITLALRSTSWTGQQPS